MLFTSDPFKNGDSQMLGKRKNLESISGNYSRKIAHSGCRIGRFRPPRAGRVHDRPYTSARSLEQSLAKIPRTPPCMRIMSSASGISRPSFMNHPVLISALLEYFVKVVMKTLMELVKAVSDNAGVIAPSSFVIIRIGLFTLRGKTIRF
ncbi:hypothetical protein PILCRDRAFT_458729 [Piloderma croceum F 1598]|uniref:Uncharacterized protein n=1 Tax=Piloderma croceum (strain F 1598) TaxID=765440 RepID=A0A0C3BZQ5_PILCF|nr:hypothetical protein PILCRDRAFT_458729 [Piloderma croceum F 1598]